MKEIKFRAWGKYNGKEQMMSWEHLCDQAFNNGEGVLINLFRGDFESIPMQFTGLKDKNGKEIYEGDILKTNTRVEFEDIEKGEYADEFYARYTYLLPEDTVIKISWLTTSFTAEAYDLKGSIKRVFSLSELDTSNIEVIGNIYENKDLLNG